MVLCDQGWSWPRSWSWFVRCASVLLSLHAGSGFAANASYTGTFATDNTVQFFTFALSVPQTVTLRTYSYAGGLNSAGNIIPRGGFDPILAVYDGVSGAVLAVNDDGGVNVPADINGSRYDTYLQVALPVGSYKVAIMQFDNFPAGANLTDGFTGTVAVAFAGRTNAWAFDLLNVDAPAVVPAAPVVPPQPAVVPSLSGLGLFGLMCVMVLGAGRRQKRL